jgi:hypothetical protein
MVRSACRNSISKYGMSLCVGLTSLATSPRADKRGLYSFAGLYSGQVNVVWASKEGFEDPFPQHYPENSEGGQALTIDGNTRFDIQLVRRDFASDQVQIK